MVGLMSRQTWQNSGISDIRSGQTSWNFVSDRTRVCLTRWFFCKNQYFIKTDWIKHISNEWPLDLISFHFVLFSKIYFMFENFVITLICQNQFKARIPLPWLALFIVWCITADTSLFVHPVMNVFWFFKLALLIGLLLSDICSMQTAHFIWSFSNTSHGMVDLFAMMS